MVGFVCIQAIAYKLLSVMGLKQKERRIGMTAEQATRELEKLKIAELVVKGNEIQATEKLTTTGGTTVSLMHLFSFGEEATFPGV